MPDPIDDLEGFTMSPVTPLPPGEVRRRGDRIRRRNRALVAAGTLAAVAVIATPFAVLAGGNGSPGGQTPVGPATQPPGGWRTTIPAGFDLGALPEGAGFSFETGADGIGTLPMCGTTAFSDAGTVDSAGAAWGQPGSDGSADRTLVLYSDGAGATAALATLEHAVEDCPRDPNGSGAPLVHDVVSSGPTSLVFTQQAADGSLRYDLTAFQVVVSGNALYLATAHTAAGGEQAMGTVDDLVANSAPVVAQLCTFSVEGCTQGLAGTIPDDFPLEKGLPTGAGTLDGPAHEIDLAPYDLDRNLTACGAAPTGLPEPVDTLHAGHRTPAEGHLRTLMTFGSVAEAQAYAEGLLAVYANCPEDTAGGVSKLYRVTPGDLGDYAASAVMRVEVGGEPAPGYEVVQVVRVGQAVLRTVVLDDGGDALDDAGADRLSTMLLENSQSVADAMG